MQLLTLERHLYTLLQLLDRKNSYKLIYRSLQAVYKEEATYSGVPVSKYVIDDVGDMATSPKDMCFCPTPDTCPKKGLMDLSKCGNPVVASLPHFYGCDPSVFQNIKGLHPKKENHSIIIFFETVSPRKGANSLV